MASSSSVNLVREVVQKQDDGNLGQSYTIGATFENIVDADRVGASGYTLADFFDNYYNFIRNTFFTYVGTVEPSNTHVSVWIDTGHQQNKFN